MDDTEQFGVNKKHVDGSKACDPMWEDTCCTNNHTAECKDVVSVEVIMEEGNDCNKTLDSDRVHSAVEGVEESSIPAGVHWQQVELSEDVRTEQQEPTDCEQEGTGSGNLDNMKTLQYVVMTTLCQLLGSIEIGCAMILFSVCIVRQQSVDYTLYM